VVWEATPRYFNSISVHYEYDPKALCPHWEEFLNSVWPDDPESIRTLRQIFGYLLTQRNDLQKMFLLYGAKRGGKGTIIRILSALLGDENVAATSMAELRGEFALAGLEGKTLAVMSDLRFRGKDDGVAVERMLKITGNDKVLINRKHKQPYDATLSTRFLIASNELPKLYDESGAIQTRMILLKFTQSFLGREDMHLETRLRWELPGILNWALDGLDDLKACGKFIQPAAGDEELEMIEHLSSPFHAFAQDCCEITPAGKRSKKELYGVYGLWCKENGMTTATHKSFASGLKSLDPNISNRGKVNTSFGRDNAYEGIDLNENGLDLLRRWHSLNAVMPDWSQWGNQDT
jgi:putative DNA primase/helicase